MTFTEAALEVLRTAGEPLHYKKITELAIERNLLSHVGKTPEVTMSSRLAMMVKKDRGQAPIMKVKPGVFAIRESALQGTSLSPEALAAISEVEGLEEPKNGATVEATSSEEAVSIPPKAPSLPGSDVFPEEEGDDDPILAGLEQETEAGDRAGRRRRRRRRRKGDKPETGVEAAAPQRAENAPREPQRERFSERARPARPERPERQERAARSERERSDRNERSGSDRNERSERQDRNERFDRAPSRNDERRPDDRSDGARTEESLDWSRQPADGDLLGKDLADAVSAVMARGDRAPHTFARVAELLVRRGRLSGSPAALAPTIAAAVRADIARAELQRSRPRFRLRAGRLSLSDWHLPKGLQRAEQDLLAGAERYAGELRRAMIQKLSELPTAGFAELLATWLNAEGVTALRAVRRPGSSGSELHFAGTRKTGSEEVRLAIVVQRGGRDIDREGIIDVRGALHHYGQAQVAWVVTLGRITSGAREEASAQAAACALFDGQALVAAMERLGVAVRRNVIAHYEIDYDLLEALGDSPEQRERREREQDRERRDHNDRTRATNATNHGRGRSGGRGASNARAEGREERLDQERDRQEQPEARPVKLRDADWDDEAAPHTEEAASDDNGVSTKESLAPRGYGLRDTADERREDGESAQLRDELEADADESAEDEDFATTEEVDEDFAAPESESDDVEDESDESDTDEDADDEAEADEADEDDDDDEVSDSDESDDSESDEGDEDADSESEDGESDDTEAAPEDVAEERGEAAGRVRRR